PAAVDDHQTRNAAYLVDHNAARLLKQENLTPELLADEMLELLADRDRLLGMAESARALSKPKATEEVARYCLSRIAGEACDD
ncbi:MAG: UDP-N-acetylglucosamine--N-acetylmuramyl-(pentapeptide) pyrophosphoryl-undecaprenol N-acetylglucosamine transferase, partial [Gammaproteobacteria bacterium]|nr:UDP-N-acetylglucosamine--N-acetylmuramyl-(pentapeptide) pyrophosphoryl-undecaprenol N-acetylglucosamine transferase [Gammaproteobacteria bacterium]